MTYNPSVPLSSDSPSIFPAQGQGNFGRLQTLFSADHQFNLSSAANDGYHTLVHLIPQAPSGALAATGRVYSKSVSGVVQLFYMDDVGTEYQITPSASGNQIRAFVNFSGLGSTSIRSQYNVSSVTYVATGRYQVNFTVPLSNNNYIVQVTGMRNSSSSLATTCVEGNSSYNSVVTTNSVRVNGFNNAGNLQDLLMCSVAIFSTT